MKYFFKKTTNHHVGNITSSINNYLNHESFSTNLEYIKVIRKLKRLIKKESIPNDRTKLFEKEIKSINKNRTLTEKTDWGGVSLKYVNVGKNKIKKLLVIKKLGVLGFEYHKLKHEKLKILEGKCVLFYSNHKSKGWEKGQICYKLAKPYDKFEFCPYDEHGIIALKNSVIEETSTNDLDDLVFVYTLK